MAKKVKPATSAPEGSPASSAPSTPRKSAMAERIAQEKARLKKLEHELSEKLKLYGRRQEKGKNHPSMFLSKQSQNSKHGSTDVERMDGVEIQPLQQSEGPETQQLDSRGQHLQLPGGQNKDSIAKDTDNPVAMEMSITPEQLERIKKLQVNVMV